MSHFEEIRPLIDKVSELAPRVGTRADFIEFLNVLADDCRTNGAAWENRDLAGFLDALASFAEDIPGYYRNTGQAVDVSAPSWRGFAEMLCGGRLYE